MRTKQTWKRKCRLDGKVYGTLVLPRPPVIGSRIIITDYESYDNKRIIVTVEEIADDCVTLRR